MGPDTLAPTMASAQIFEADAVGGEPREIGLDAHRRPDAALDRDAADAADLGQPLRHQRVGESLSSRSAIVSEVSASVMIGASAGFTLA